MPSAPCARRSALLPRALGTCGPSSHIRSRLRSPTLQKRSSQRSIKAKTAQPERFSLQEKVKAHGAVFSVQAVFALWYIVGHLVLRDNDPLTFALARELLSASALVVLAQKFEGEIKLKDSRDAVDVVLLGLMCYAVVMGFMFALSDLPEVTVAIAQPLVPALALGMSAVLGIEMLSYVSLGGILVSVAGAIAFVAFNAAGSGGQEGHAFGYAALVLELLAYAAQMVYLPNLSKRYKPLTLTAMYYTVATAASAATLILRDKEDLWSIPSQALILVNPVVFGALIFAVLGPTVFSFTALSYSSKKLKPSVNSAYITLQPVLVAVLSLLLFGDRLSTPEIESGCVVLAGLYLTVIGNPTVDRAWREYVSDLGTNVPQTIENVADAAVTATENVAESVAGTVVEVQESVAGTVVEVQESVAETVTDMKERMEFIVADASDSLEQRSNIAVRQLEELTSVKDKK